MKRLSKAKRLILRSETEIRALVAEAAQEGDYDEILKLAGLAKAVGSIASSLQDFDEEQPEAAGFPEPFVPVIAPLSNGSGNQSSGRARGKGAKATKRRYPYFIRSGDELVKVGWSKSSGKEYTHKAPQAVLDVLVGELPTHRLADGNLKSPQEFLPLTDKSGNQIPDYQTYLCIAWLRDIGVVTRDGRHGHRLPDVDRLSEQAALAWKQLKTE